MVHGDTLTEPMKDFHQQEFLRQNQKQIQLLLCIHYIGFENSTLFIDASMECIKVTNNNKLTDTNIETIISIYANREAKEHVSVLVPNDKIGDNDYNLSISSYVEQIDTRKKIDIIVLNKEIAEIVAREQVLRDEIDKNIAEIEV